MTKADMMVSKMFSAQWLMAVGVTFGATIITFVLVWKKSEYANTALTVYMSNWGIIIANYFRRDKTQDNAVINSSKTELKTEVASGG